MDEWIEIGSSDGILGLVEYSTPTGISSSFVTVASFLGLFAFDVVQFGWALLG